MAIPKGANETVTLCMFFPSTYYLFGVVGLLRKVYDVVAGMADVGGCVLSQSVATKYLLQVCLASDG